MKRPVIAAVVLAAAACSRANGPSGEPIDRMFDVRYERFISSAKGHRGGCEISLSAKGDGGTRNDGVTAEISVDDEGDYDATFDGSFETRRIGSVAWQRENGSEPFKRVESGARADLLRDDAIVGWRDVLLPLRSRLTLTRTGSAELGERSLEVYEIAAEPGGGADGSVQVLEGKGTVSLDSVTGFPVALQFEGAWEGPATPPAEGRVTWTVQKMECAVTSLGGVEKTVSPETTPAPTATPSPAESPAAKPTAKPAAPKPKPTRR